MSLLKSIAKDMVRNAVRRANTEAEKYDEIAKDKRYSEPARLRAEEMAEKRRDGAEKCNDLLNDSMKDW